MLNLTRLSRSLGFFYDWHSRAWAKREGHSSVNTETQGQQSAQRLGQKTHSCSSSRCRVKPSVEPKTYKRDSLASLVWTSRPDTSKECCHSSPLASSCKYTKDARARARVCVCVCVYVCVCACVRACARAQRHSILYLKRTSLSLSLSHQSHCVMGKPAVPQPTAMHPPPPTSSSCSDDLVV